MRVVVLAGALLLVGCEHIYVAGDTHISDADAIRIARREAAVRRIPLDGLKPTVARFDTGVSIFFEAPGCSTGDCIDGGLPHFFIKAGERRVSYIRTSY